MKLEEELHKEKLFSLFRQSNVSEQNMGEVEVLLGSLRCLDKPTYGHSIRTGILGYKITDYMHLDPKVLLFAGTLHDLGKCKLQQALIKKTENFTNQDMEKIKAHPLYTYKLLIRAFPFAAEVAVGHHFYQEDSYPEQLPEPNIPYSKRTRLIIDFYRRLLSLVDSYDAMSTRENEKFVRPKRLLKPEEVKTRIVEENKDLAYLINNLYRDGIFNNKYPSNL